MTAKVKASVHAADAGIPVVITRCIAVLFSFLKNTIFESIFISPLQILFNEFLGPVCYGIIKKWLFLRKA
jgi:hypothetical protein